MTAISNALNHHGTFLKKGVIDILKSSNVKIIQEEFPVSFDNPTAVDLVAQVEETGHNTDLVIECKKIHAEKKQWVFVSAHNSCFRIGRVITAFGIEGCYSCANPLNESIPIASEGYEIQENDTGAKADPNVMYKSADQLSRQCCGYTQNRFRAFSKFSENPNFNERLLIVPCLVTNASLKICTVNGSQVSLATGELNSDINFEDRDWIVLKHPFSTTENKAHSDFRLAPSYVEDMQHPNTCQVESLYVINAQAFGKFILERPWKHSHVNTPTNGC